MSYHGGDFPHLAPFFDLTILHIHAMLANKHINTLAASEIIEGETGLKKWECVQVNHHNNVGKTIEEFQSRGWSLHTYSAAQLRGSEINHYLLFEKDE
jgi:hypothetical protein